ncbi:P-loop containing nucleoside triphosphate hydrolase protein [Suillus occidentalis]|nr:P-loop containing nucleoside triphosphate hydrolase protein [Suillus occidentalis]
MGGTFDEAKRVAPCLRFKIAIMITPKRESAQREMERRIVLTCMDDMSWEKTENKSVIVIGATNRPDSLDAALRRAGRFDYELSMGVPDEETRNKILRQLCAKLRLDGDFNFVAFAKATPGYVGAYLSALTGAAGVIAVKRIFKQLTDGTLVLPEAAENIGQDTPMAVDSPPTPPADITPSMIPFVSTNIPTLYYFFHRVLKCTPLSSHTRLTRPSLQPSFPVVFCHGLICHVLVEVLNISMT